MKKKPFFFILILVGILLYLPSLFGPFLWDDEDFVYANRYVKEFQIREFFTDSVTAGRDKGSNYFRPVQLTTYATAHVFFGFNPFVFHLLNVAVHILAAWAVLGFLTLLFKRLKVDQTTVVSTVPFVVALLFLIHPVQTEAVSYISGLSDPLFVLFGLLSLITFLLKDERKNMTVLSIVFFMLSILSKETGLVFLPLLLITSVLGSPHQSLKKTVTETFKSSLPYVVFTLLYLWYHFTAINNFDMQSAWGSSPYGTSVVVRLLTFIQNLYLYVGLLLFPKDLFMERDYTVVVQSSVTNWYLLGFIVANAVIFLGLNLLRARFPKGNWLILLFSFLGFYLCFIPYTGIVLINGIFYEHFLYLPLVFFFTFWLVLLGTTLEARIKKLGLIVLILFILVLTLLGLRNVYRQFDWNNDIRFYSETLKRAPKSIRIINGLGMAQANRGDFEESIKTYQRGLSLDPNIPNFYHNLANIYVSQGKFELAEENYHKAIEVNPRFIFSWQSLGNLFQQTGQKEKYEMLSEEFSKQQK